MPSSLRLDLHHFDTFISLLSFHSHPQNVPRPCVCVTTTNNAPHHHHPSTPYTPVSPTHHTTPHHLSFATPPSPSPSPSPSLPSIYPPPNNDHLATSIPAIHISNLVADALAATLRTPGPATSALHPALNNGHGPLPAKVRSADHAPATHKCHLLPSGRRRHTSRGG